MAETRERYIVDEDGTRTAVVLPIADYQELLERLEDLADLRALKAARRRPLRFRRLEDFLKHQPRFQELKNG